MPKKTLNEATVRQFMKLVNHKPATISNFISENYAEEKELEEGAYAEGEEQKMEEGVYEEEEAMEEMAAPVAEEEEDADPVGEEMPEPPDEPAGKAGEVDITPEMAEVLIDLGDMLKSAMPEMGDEPMDEPMGDDPMDMPEPPPAEDDEEPADMMEAEDANEEMNEEEMIQEVARRVAARILKAKNAKKELDAKK